MLLISKPLIGKAEKKAVLKVLSSGRLTQGEVVAKFEKRFADFTGAKFAIATASGTTALHLSLLAHGIGPGDEVITSPFTFIATVNAIRFVGATPLFSDIEYHSFNLDPAKIESRITPNTKAIIPVHLYGGPAQIIQIGALAQKHKLTVIEDACQAHGAMIFGKKIGSFNTTCFSFYATKNMTTGEGGMVVTNDKNIAQTLRSLRNHGSNKRYQYKILGLNYRMTDIQAALGLAQLDKLIVLNKRRINNALFLNSKLKNILTCPIVLPNTKHVFHLYTVRLNKNRNLVKSALLQKGIECGIYYPKPVHLESIYKYLKYKRGDFPVAETATKEVLSLPVHPALKQKDLKYIVKSLKTAVSKCVVYQ